MEDLPAQVSQKRSRGIGDWRSSPEHFGYLLAGKEGAVNMAYWGLALGLLGGFASGVGVLFEAGYWGRGENIQNLPEWNWFVKKDEERKNSPR